jgi:hypothetical protein
LKIHESEEKMSKRFVSRLAVFFISTAAFADGVITSGLPAGSAIVNISGTEDGAAEYNTGSPHAQTYWYDPFNINGDLLEYTVQPGTYSFRIVDPAAAASLEPGLTSAELASIYTAWTYNTPWATDYLVFDSSAATDPSEYQLFTGAVTPLADYPGFANATDAYNSAITGGYYDQIVSGVGGRYDGTTSTTYTFTSAETLIFAVPDYYLPDNAGGVSVLISKVSATTPEPGMLIPLIGGAMFLVIRRRRSSGSN